MLKQYGGILVQCYILLNNGNMQSSGFILNGKQNAKFLGTIVSFLAYKIYELIFFFRSHYKSETHYMMIFFLLKEHNIDVLLELSIDKYINFEYIPPSR